LSCAKKLNLRRLSLLFCLSLDAVSTISRRANDFECHSRSSFNSTRPILKICELLLKDSSLDLEVIGDKSAYSFTIDMNKLFEDFVANLLIEKLGEGDIKLQQTEYPEVKGSKLKVRLDIEIFRHGIPHIVLDTKYKEYADGPDMGYIAQLSLYSLSTQVKNCGLIYPGKFEPELFLIKPDIRVHILSFNLIASNKLEFEENCSQFLENLKSLPL
jgi:5-methylcytosine-specific restriction endonuclease McrBC regulatory subunit McrC